MGRRIRTLVIAAAALALVAPGTAAAQGTRLVAVVGPGFTISLTDANGARVTQLDPGTYQVAVDDRSEEHNFHLVGPGVDQRTEVEFIGQVTWTVTLVDGRYDFMCDPHASTMRGRFTVGNPPPEPPPPPPPPAPPPTPALTRLLASVGPGFTIGVRSARGAVVRTVRAGVVSVVVRDRSRLHNFHLTGPGVNRKTTVAFVGTRTWSLRVRKGATYRFVCDPHAAAMKGSFRGV